MAFHQFTLDDNLQLKDAGLVAADAAWTVSAAAQILDVGGNSSSGIGAARFVGAVLIDVSAIEIASGDETYALSIQGSSSATFASTIQELACLRLGDASTIGSARDVDSTVGRYLLPFTNEQDSVVYRYIRGYTDVSGTIATGINFTAYVVQWP